MTDHCIFCRIVDGLEQASVVFEDDRTLAFIDLRQANPGHVLVIPKVHINDVRELDRETGAALMQSVSQITRAVSQAFPNNGLSLWHSIGEGAFQEVPHLHIHVHPRLRDDGILQVYPTVPEDVDVTTRDRYAEMVRLKLPAFSIGEFTPSPFDPSVPVGFYVRANGPDRA